MGIENPVGNAFLYKPDPNGLNLHMRFQLYLLLQYSQRQGDFKLLAISLIWHSELKYRTFVNLTPWHTCRSFQAILIRRNVIFLSEASINWALDGVPIVRNAVFMVFEGKYLETYTFWNLIVEPGSLIKPESHISNHNWESLIAWPFRNELQSRVIFCSKKPISPWVFRVENYFFDFMNHKKRTQVYFSLDFLVTILKHI